MPPKKVTFSLISAYEDFVGLILSLSSEQFLSSMDGWCPRDVIAHLIGWNNLMIEASRSILAGKPPAYYDDASNDYSNINSVFTTRYSSRSKQELLAELKSSMAGFETFVLALPDRELLANHGVSHHQGGPATVSKIITSLAGDYSYHAQQIREWQNKIAESD